MSSQLTTEQVTAALATVNDPEIRKPITELDMVKSIDIAPDGAVSVGIFLTVAGCPMKDTITRNVTEAVARLDGVSSVRVELDVMSEEQRKDLQTKLRGGEPAKEIPFAKPNSLTKVYAVASGKGGVGKSSVTVNLAAALAAQGRKVGVVDADIYGHSVPRMLGVEQAPTKVADMIMPPSAHDVKVISVGMFTAGNQPVVWRGPMLHRALQQFLADVYWGDLDILLMDLPPGTGDIAISVAQLLPSAEILVVTTPQQAAAEVAERAGCDRRADAPAGRRRDREHVLPHLRALRRAAGHLRLGRRPVRGRRPHPDPRHPRPAPRPGADRHAAARGRRQRHPAGAVRPRQPAPPRSCAPSPTGWRAARAGWRACRSASPPRAADPVPAGTGQTGTHRASSPQAGRDRPLRRSSGL